MATGTAGLAALADTWPWASTSLRKPDQTCLTMNGSWWRGNGDRNGGAHDAPQDTGDRAEEKRRTGRVHKKWKNFPLSIQNGQLVFL